jgi:predicted GNAT family N-acyltransferase
MMSVDVDHKPNDMRVEVVRDLNEYMKIVAIRASVFLAEQDCPYDEEFDQNDLQSCHLIAYLRGEPVATLRIRWFAGFAKIERVCVMKHVRGGALVKLLIETAVDLISRKGYRTAIGYIQKRLVPFWRQLGFTAREGRAGFRFSDYDYVECSRELPQRHDALSIDSDPYVIMRPEGAWDHENVLDRSALRPAVA